MINFGMAMAFSSGPFCLFDALGHRPHGSTSALLSASQLGAANLESFLVGTFYDGSVMPLAATMAGLPAVGAFGYILLG